MNLDISFLFIRRKEQEKMLKRRQKRLRDQDGGSPAKKKFVNDTGADWELSIVEPILSEQSTSDDSMQDKSTAVRFSIDIFWCFIIFISILNHDQSNYKFL